MLIGSCVCIPPVTGAFHLASFAVFGERCRVHVCLTCSRRRCCSAGGVGLAPTSGRSFVICSVSCRSCLLSVCPGSGRGAAGLPCVHVSPPDITVYVYATDDGGLCYSLAEPPPDRRGEAVSFSPHFPHRFPMLSLFGGLSFVTSAFGYRQYRKWAELVHMK